MVHFLAAVAFDAPMLFFRHSEERILMDSSRMPSISSWLLCWSLTWFVSASILFDSKSIVAYAYFKAFIAS